MSSSHRTTLELFPETSRSVGLSLFCVGLGLLSFALFLTPQVAHARSITLDQVGCGALLVRNQGGYDLLPLLGMEVDLDVEGILVRGDVTQVFHNPGVETVEAI